MTKRKSLSKRVRFEVFKRDGFRCMYCGAHPPAVVLHVDHINPVSAGGEDSIDNLITACQPCNAGKSDVPLSSAPQSLASRASEVREREEQIRGFNAVMEAARSRIEDEAWEVAEVWMASHAKASIRKDWLVSIKMFIQRLGFHECLNSMETAVSRQRGQDASFRYFCGICWAKIREHGGAQ